MAHIKKVSFYTADQNSGCTCDRCGQYIKNIWTVEYVEGMSLHYGIDCFEKVLKTGRLTDYGKKLMKKAMKGLERVYAAMNKAAELTAETDIWWQEQQADKLSAWYGESYDDYKVWQFEELYPYHISKYQQEIEKFKNADFEI